MLKLFDKAFWKFTSGFVLVLILSFSILTLSSVWKETRENSAALLQAFLLSD